VPTPAKTLVVSIVSAVTFAFAAAPAVALPATEDSGTEFAAVQPASSSQTFNTGDNALETRSLDSLLSLTDVSAVSHGYDVQAAIAQAASEIGTSRATGWDQPGECISSVFRWLDAGGVVPHHGGNPVDNYRGALRLTINQAGPGDVVQYEHIDYPTSWVTGVHTLLITGVNGDGTFSIIESNVPYGSGLVTENKSWAPAPPAGFQAVVWRF